MILIIIFGLIFLIGIAFLAAVVGTSFLKKYAERTIEATDLSLKESYYREHFHDEYEEQIAERREVEERERAAEAAQAPPRQLPYAAREVEGSVWKWISVVAGVVIVVALVFFFGTGGFKGGERKPGLYFCESVDFTKLKPVHKSNTFTRGNVTLFVKSRSPLDLDGARVEIYKASPRGYKPYASEILTLKPEWTSFSVSVLFDSIGSYLVSVSGKDGTLINQKNISIVPDSYAYKPVPAAL